jgi:hypothetical protein
VLPKEKIPMLLSHLDDGAVDVQKAIQRGALILCTPEEAYLKGGAFDRRQMAQLLDDMMRESLKLGFTGFRGTGDLTWAVNDSNHCGQLVQYEQALDKYYPGKAAVGICMYDASQFDQSQLNQVMEAHRLSLSASSAGKRKIRIRNGKAFGDVIFDRVSPKLFHYRIQKTGSNELLNLGQEASLVAAMDSVESILSSMNASA